VNRRTRLLTSLLRSLPFLGWLFLPYDGAEAGGCADIATGFSLFCPVLSKTFRSLWPSRPPFSRGLSHSLFACQLFGSSLDQKSETIVGFLCALRRTVPCVSPPRGNVLLWLPCCAELCRLPPNWPNVTTWKKSPVDACHPGIFPTPSLAFPTDFRTVFRVVIFAFPHAFL